MPFRVDIIEHRRRFDKGFGGKSIFCAVADIIVSMINVDVEVKGVRRAMNGSVDLVIKEVNAGEKRIALAYIDGMVEMREVDMGIVTPIIGSKGDFVPDLEGMNALLETAESLKTAKTRKEAVTTMSCGECLIIVDGAEELFTVGVQGYVVRTIMEPPTSAVIKGPREGFTEDFKTNMVLIRRRFSSGNLVFKSVTVGRYTQTQVKICYIKGVARREVVREIENKIKAIDIDGIVDSSNVAKFLESRNYSVLKQVGTTEKPDIFAAKLLDGRVGILVDGSPIALTLPFMMVEDFYDIEDYYRRPVRTAIVRTMRLLGVFFAVFLPGVFVALLSHQYQMLPIKLLITIINSINGIPFSPITEMLIALVLFEVLGEASVRMPRYLGMAISVVGGIILGETAVNAGILSSLTVLIVALSSIGLYAVPDEVGTFSVVRLLLVLIGGSLGVYGVLLASITLVTYIANFEVYGVPYLAPFAPIVGADLKDSLVKFALKDSPMRTAALGLSNKRRMRDGK